MLHPAEDATVTSTSPDQAFCSQECLDVYQASALEPGDLAARSYLYFDLSDVSVQPPIETVLAAFLDLTHCEACSLPGSAVVRAYEVTEPWDCIGAVNPPISWSWQPSHAPTPAGEAVCKAGGLLEIQIHALVQKWVDDPAGNFGLVLTVNEASTADQAFSFLSADGSTGDDRPTLLVRYQ